MIFCSSIYLSFSCILSTLEFEQKSLLCERLRLISMHGIRLCGPQTILICRIFMCAVFCMSFYAILLRGTWRCKYFAFISPYVINILLLCDILVIFWCFSTYHIFHIQTFCLDSRLSSVVEFLTGCLWLVQSDVQSTYFFKCIFPIFHSYYIYESK